MARKVFGDSLKNAMGKASTSDEDADIDLKRTSPTVARAQASVLEETNTPRADDPSTVRMSAVMDRIDPSDGLEELVSSIREHGQKVPILVRRTQDGALEIVYGRRRLLLACRELGQKVRATVMEMTEEEALIAQGVKTMPAKTPRLSRGPCSSLGSFGNLGKLTRPQERQTIAYRALQIDESLVSRMNRIATGIPMELIHASDLHTALVGESGRSFSGCARRTSREPEKLPVKSPATCQAQTDLTQRLRCLRPPRQLHPRLSKVSA